MASICFPSLADGEVIEVEFLDHQGGTRRLRLLVDTGFCGRSSFILGSQFSDLFRAVLPPTTTFGAIQGTQMRAWVTCRIPELSFQSTVIAIVTELAALSLPENVHGMAGLTFLRMFSRWGAVKPNGEWQFYLSNDQDELPK